MREASMWRQGGPRGKKKGLTVRQLLVILAAILIVGTVILNFCIFSSICWSQTVTSPTVVGYYAGITKSDAQESGKVHRWWRCAGGLRALAIIINSLRIIDLEPHEFITYESMYYIKSAEKALMSLLPDSSSFNPLKIEMWKDYSTGVHGMIDFEVGMKNGSKQMHTIEYDDDTARAVEISLRDVHPADKSRIVLVTTIYNRERAFRNSLRSLESVIESGETNIAYCLADFGGDDTDVRKELEERGISSRITTWVLDFPPPFTKAPALDACIASANSDDIIFIMDVDMKYSPKILKRLRRFVVQGRRLYAPIVYYLDEDPDSGESFKNDPAGWAYEGTGIIALYKSDIDRFGGYDSKNFGRTHGFEDTDFFFAARSVKLEIARPKERELTHVPHGRSGWQASAGPKDPECSNP